MTKKKETPTPAEVEEAKEEVEEAKEEVEEAKEEVADAETPAEEKKADAKLDTALENLAEKQLSAKEIEDAVAAGTKRALSEHVAEQDEARRVAAEQEDNHEPGDGNKPDDAPPDPDAAPPADPPADAEPESDTKEPRQKSRWFGASDDGE